MAEGTINLVLEPRQVFGKAVKHLRKSDIIPAVIHNHGQPSIHVQAERMALIKVWRQAGKHHPVELTAGQETYTALIKSIAFDPRKHQLTHIVFNAVDRNQKVETEIPIKPRYNEGNDASPAERSGLIVLSQLENVLVKALPTDLPDFLEYDAEKLVEIGDHATVADLIVPAAVEIEAEADHAVATVYEPSALAAANELAGGDAEEAAPEEEAEAGAAEAEGTEAEEGDGDAQSAKAAEEASDKGADS